MTDLSNALASLPAPRAAIVQGVERALARIVRPDMSEALEELCDQARRAIDHAVQIARAASTGRRLVVSLDICELLDASETDRSRALRRAGLPDRRVLVDVLASRRALEIVKSGAMSFTLLPGVSAEATNRLRNAYARAGRLLRSLRDAPPAAPRSAKSWSQQRVVKRDHTRREKWIRDDAAAILSSSRLLDLLEELLGLPGYVSATELAGGFALVHDEIMDFAGQIAKARKPGAGEDTRFADLMDSVNLLFAAGATNEDTIVCHMTRTATLHRLPSGGYMRFAPEAEVGRGGLGPPVPTLIHPHVVTLLSLLGMRSGGLADTYERAEEFGRHAAQALSFIRTYAFHLRTATGFGVLRNDVDELINVQTRNRAHGNVLAMFLNHVLEDLLYAEQLTARRHSRQEVAVINRKNAQALVAMQQRSMLRVVHLLSPSLGLASTELAAAVLDGDPTMAEAAGFFVERSNPGSRARECRIFAEADRTWLVAGVSISERATNGSINIYWPSEQALTEFVKAVYGALGERVMVLWESHEPRLRTCLGARKKGGPECAEVLARLAEGPARAAQLGAGGVLATWESPGLGRDGLTGISFDAASANVARRCYESFGPAVAWEALYEIATRLLAKPRKDEAR